MEVALVIDEDGNGRPERTMDSVLREVSQEFWISRFRIKRGERNRAVVVARDEFCRRMYEEGYSYSDIGRFLRLHHTSIITAVQRARARLSGAPEGD